MKNVPKFLTQTNGKAVGCTSLYRDIGKANSMSLVFALLQKEYIVLAADNRHTRGDTHGGYKNDDSIKTVVILEGYGVLGFAGQDFGEQIVFPAEHQRLLNDSRNLRDVGRLLSDFAVDRYQKAYGRDLQSGPVVEILLTGGPGFD